MVLTKMKCGEIGISLIQKILKIGLCCEKREGSKCRAAVPGRRARRALGARVGRCADNPAEEAVSGRSWLCAAMGWTFHPGVHRDCLESAPSRMGRPLATRLRLGPNLAFSLILGKKRRLFPHSPMGSAICDCLVKRRVRTSLHHTFGVSKPSKDAVSTAYSLNGTAHVGPGVQVLGLRLQVQCIGKPI